MTPRRMNQILKGSLAALLVASFAVLYLANKQLVSTANKTARLRAEVAVGQQQVKLYQNTKLKVDSLGYVNELANKVLPADKDQSTIIAELSQFALRAGLTVNQINFADSTKPATTTKNTIIPSGVTVVPVTIQLKTGAKYQDLLSFLRMLETNQRKSQVTNISLSPDTSDRSKLNQVNISLNVYAQKQAAKSGQ